ncbi:retrovirus-related pol polyprotein from transposon TNT 1-94 [Tanacetum coccineum]
MLMVDDNVGNQFRQNAVQNVGHLIGQNAVQNQGNQNVGNHNRLSVVPEIVNQHGNGNVVTARAEGNGNDINGNQIRCYNCRGEGHYASNYTVKPRKRDAAYLQTQLQIDQKEEAGIQLNSDEFDYMASAVAYDETDEVNANCTLKDNLQQASTSDTQTDKAPVYDSDRSAEVHHSENCYDNDIFNMFTQVWNKVGGTVEQNPIEETCVLYDSLYNNLSIEVEKVNMVNRNLKATNVALTTELARYKNQEKFFEINQEKYDKLERLQNFEIQFLKEVAKFVQDFKSLANKADEYLDKQKTLELEIERLLRAVIMPPRMMTHSAGRPTAVSRGGRMGGRAGRGGGRTGSRFGDQCNGMNDGQGGQVGGQGSKPRMRQCRGQGNGRNQNGDAINDNIRGDVRNVIENNDRRDCTYKEFLACNPKEYDGKGVKYTAGSFVGKALTWWNSHIRTLGQQVAVGMSWDNFKVLMREEFCPSNETQKLETELWNHTMIRGMVAATEPSTIQKAVQIAGTLTDEALRNGLIKKNHEKRGNEGEPSKDRNGRDDN